MDVKRINGLDKYKILVTLDEVVGRCQKLLVKFAHLKPFHFLAVPKWIEFPESQPLLFLPLFQVPKYTIRDMPCG